MRNRGISHWTKNPYFAPAATWDSTSGHDSVELRVNTSTDSATEVAVIPPINIILCQLASFLPFTVVISVVQHY